MLTVLQASSTQNLIALATVRNRLLNGDTSQDAKLQDRIASASSAVHGYLGRSLARQHYRLVLAGRGRRRLYLRLAPLDPDSITVEIDDEAITDFEVEDVEAGVLFRQATWPELCTSPTEDPEENITVELKAGYVLPDQVQTYAAALVLTAGLWIRPSSPALSPFLFEVTTGGTTAGAEPSWPDEAGETVSGGGAVVLTARVAQELPLWISDLAYVEVYHRWLNREPGLAGRSDAGASEQYFATHTGEDLAPAVRVGLDRLRFAA